MRSISKPWLVRAAVAAAFALLAQQAARADPEIYQRAIRSTGWVIVPSDDAMASGTCWLVDSEKKLLVTCEHVVGKSKDVLVYFPRFERDELLVESGDYLRKLTPIDGRVLATDAERDLALVQLAALPAGVEALPLAKKSPSPGETVHSIGNSGLYDGLSSGSLWWYTQGTVRQVSLHRVESKDKKVRVRMIETQSPVNRGDSGGPVLNGRGEVVGVTDSYDARERLVSQNIDIQEVRKFLAGAALAQAAPAAPKDARGQAMVGDWKFQVRKAADAKGKAEVKAFGGSGSFRRDGSFVLTSQKGAEAHHRQGKFIYLNGVLWLIFDGFDASSRLTWQNQDRFTLKSGESELVFERDKAKVAAKR